MPSTTFLALTDDGNDFLFDFDARHPERMLWIEFRDDRASITTPYQQADFESPDDAAHRLAEYLDNGSTVLYVDER